MDEQDAAFPAYQWKKNKGYPTKAHRAAIEQVGPSPIHRMSFNLVDRQLKLEFPEE
jgi:ribonuclease HII